MSNYSYSQPTPWTLSVKDKNKQKREKKESFDDGGPQDTFKTARQALIYNQMMAGKSNRNLVDNSSSSDAFSSTTNNNDFNTNSTVRSNHCSQNSNLPAYQPFQPPYAQNKRLGVTGPYRNPMRRPDDGSFPTINRPCSQPSSSSSINSNPTVRSVTNNNPTARSATNQDQMSTELLEICADERAKNLDSNIIEKILNEIIDKKSEMSWDEIGGLGKIKDELEEIVILPMKRPDIFVDLLSPCKGLLLFGPPGTGEWDRPVHTCVFAQTMSNVCD